METSKMSVAYQSGLDYLKSYAGILNILEGALHVTLIVFATFLELSFQAQFLCGVAIYGFISVIVLLAFHTRGIVKDSDFPWFWVQCINCGFLALLLLVGSCLVINVLTKGCILTGIIGLIAVLVYCLDAIEQYNMAKTPRARYVWTTPNMTE